MDPDAIIVWYSIVFLIRYIVKDTLIRFLSKFQFILQFSTDFMIFIFFLHIIHVC